MKILISGSSGLIGSSLIPTLVEIDWQVNRLVRTTRTPANGDVFWDPAGDVIETDQLNGHDCVIHLAGESIVGLWTQGKKARIRTSRIGGTRLLSESLASLKSPPGILVCASAIGFYGDRGEEILTEDSPVGRGFLTEVCKAWEEATAPAEAAGIRVVHLRIPVVLSTFGGALAKMLPAFRLGLGGVVAGGHHYMSWCTLPEVIQIIHFVIKRDQIAGPVNLGTQHPVTNREFTKTLGDLLNRPTLLPVPGFILKFLLGEMAREMLLASTRTHPAKLLEMGYEFRHAELDNALRHVLTGA